MFTDTLDWDHFYSNHWRQSPLVVRGGARYIFAERLTLDRFHLMAELVAKMEPNSVTRGGNGVVFVQHIDLADSEFAKITADLGRKHGWYRPWFDAVHTVTGSAGGIGCHYDDSDNFVLQQSGWKRWRLHSPIIIPEQEQRRRMLKDPGVGNVYMPEKCFEVILEAGDLLYIPLLWPHWGLTAQDSLSLSLVCNTTNAARLLAGATRSFLAREPAGWQALPRVSNEEEATALFNVYWEKLISPVSREAVRTTWVTDLLISATSGPFKSSLRQPDFHSLSEHELFTVILAASDTLDALSPQATTDVIGRLERSVAARRGLNLIQCLESICALTDLPSVIDSVRVLVAGCCEMSSDALTSLLISPGAGTWISRATYDLRFGYCPRANELATWLPIVLRPAYVAAALAGNRFELALPLIDRRGICLLPEALHISRTKGESSNWLLSGNQEGLWLSDGSGLLIGPGGGALSTEYVQITPLAQEGGLWVFEDDSWFDVELARDNKPTTVAYQYQAVPEDQLRLIAGRGQALISHPAHAGIVPLCGDDRAAMRTAAAAQARILLALSEFACRWGLPGAEPWSEWYGPSARLVEMGIAAWMGYSQKTNTDIKNHIYEEEDMSHPNVQVIRDRLLSIG